MTNCETCNSDKPVGVACVPGVPYSAAYCLACLEANAHPWNILVANTACMGGLSNASDWWKGMIEDTCKHLNKTVAEFEADVAENERAWMEA